jgi:phosphomannomutase/phosphoglucomutase
VDSIAQALSDRTEFAGHPVVDVNLLNGVRITLDDNSWLLIRASSNSPNLVIVAETFDEDGSELREIDKALRKLLTDLDVSIGDFGALHEF